MQANFQRVVNTTINLVFVSNVVFYPVAGLVEQAGFEKNSSKQDEPEKTLKDAFVNTDWLGPLTPQTAKKHPGEQSVIPNQEISKSGSHTMADILRTKLKLLPSPLAQSFHYINS
ncbi:hypothetical protein [Candidatus Nitrotoga fabula]|uniref:Uncharacterized protein n=1 Tax=Candidatus Nitrotoga fabula TaxID=2182327 RepID=A0A916F8R6_9PROT|nr:hypothetical protein [Candidatus Nitrotoga fabula]CAE6709366.1 hypothetical protein NTGZN8_190012 [Candidatus Nitrotoga fabula]